MTPLDIEEVKDKYEQAIQTCWLSMDSTAMPAALAEVTWRSVSARASPIPRAGNASVRQETRHRTHLGRLPLQYLLTQCARDPKSANGLHTLSVGIAQEGCIYEIL